MQNLGGEAPLEGDMATHSHILAWRIPWTEKPDMLQSMGLQKVGHGLAIKQQITQFSTPSLWLIISLFLKQYQRVHLRIL